MILKELLKRLIEIGKTEDFDSLHIVLPDAEKKKCWHILPVVREWCPIADALSTEDLIALIKALTMIKEWSDGSVSPIIPLYKKLHERNYQKIEELTNWIFSKIDSPWVPFTNFGKKTLEDATRCRYELEQQKIDRERIGRENKQIRLQRKTAAHKVRIEKQKIETNARRSLLNKLEKMTPAARLNYIANDYEHTILFYPNQYADVNNAVLKALDPNAVESLIEKVGTRKKGAWTQLAAKLKALGQR